MPKRISVAEPKKELKTRFIEGVGRRKTAVARVRIMPGKGEFRVNDKDLKGYFPLQKFSQTAISPLELVSSKSKFKVSVKVGGGGVMAQSEAIRHGLSRALVQFDKELKAKFGKVGYLTRDSRMVERKKYGLKKARRAPQWAKR